MLREINNPIVEYAKSTKSRGLVENLRMVYRLTQNLRDKITFRWQQLELPGEPTFPNGYDFLAYFEPRDEFDRNNLLLAGSDITQADFHRLMLTLGWRRDYINRFLLTGEINKNPTPRNILTRLRDNEISSVATPNTHLLFSAPEHTVVVLMGLNFIDDQNVIHYDKMVNGALELGIHDFLPEDVVTSQMNLRPGIIDPIDILQFSQTPKAAEIFQQFPGERIFTYTPQAKQVISAMPNSEICFPKHYVNDKAKNRSVSLVGEVDGYITNSFRNLGWQVLV